MNHVILSGYVGTLQHKSVPNRNDPNKSLNVVTFLLGVKKTTGTGFFNVPCCAFGSVADFISKYFNDKDPIEIMGQWRVESYEKDGKKVFSSTCVISKVGWPPRKNDDKAPSTDDQGFMQIPDNFADELPFA